jgi:hypothetical protein
VPYMTCPVPCSLSDLCVQNAPATCGRRSSKQFGQIRVQTLFALCFLLFAICAFPFIVHGTGLNAACQMLSKVYSGAFAGKSLRKVDDLSDGAVNRHPIANLAANHTISTGIPAAPPVVVTITPATPCSTTARQSMPVTTRQRARRSSSILISAGAHGRQMAT